jgi:hypothetical protein
MEQDKEKTKDVVQSWKKIAGGDKTETRQQRLARERQERVEASKDNRSTQQRAIMEAQEYAENEIENPLRHLKNAYKAKQQAEKNKKIAKLDAQKALLLLCEVSERGGEICSVEASGFNVFTVKYVI